MSHESDEETEIVLTTGSADTDGDDSSDEEDNAKPLAKPKNYLMEAKKSGRTVDKFVTDHDPEGYSFQVFNSALGLLYSPEVNALYYQKKKALPKNTVKIDDTVLENFFTELLQETLRPCFDIKLQPNFSDGLFDEFWEENEAQIIEIIQRICLWIKNNVRTFLKKSEEIEKFLVPIQDMMAKFIEEIYEAPQAPCFDYTEHFEAELTGYMTLVYEDNGIAVDGKYHNKGDRDARPEGLNAVDALIFDHAESARGKALIAGTENLMNKLLQVEHEKEDESLVEKDEADDEDEKYRFRDHVEEEHLQESELCFLFESNQWLQHYLPITTEDVQKQLRANPGFEKRFRENWVDKKPELASLLFLQRGVFPQQHTLTSHDDLEHLANIRLAMRVQRRRIRQVMDDYPDDLFDGEEFQLSWQFHEQPFLALEKQELSKYGKRTDLVGNLGAYSTVYSFMTKFKKLINAELKQKNKQRMGDDIIAVWIRDILIHGKPNTHYLDEKAENKITLQFTDISLPLRDLFLKFLVNLSYLLLGCEAQRNPSSLIIHQMAIDLIDAGKMSWEEAIANPEFKGSCGGGALPMSMESGREPVKIARLLNARYGLFSVKTWVYEGDPADLTPSKTGNAKEFIKRDHKIIADWIALISTEKEIPAEEFDLGEEIQEAIQERWYPHTCK